MTGLRFPKWSVAALLLATFVAGCSSAPKPEQLWASKDRRVLQEVFQSLNDYYVEPLSLRYLAETGLQEVLKADEELEVVFQESQLQLRVNGDFVHGVNFEQNDLQHPASWATASHSIIKEAQKASPVLLKQPLDQQLDIFITAMLGKLDKYSRYATPSEALSIREKRDGFGGIGVSLAKEKDQIVISSIEEESPASKSDLKVGDTLIEVDGILIEGLGTEEAHTLIRGPISHQVKLLVTRNTIQQEVTLIRNQITVNTVFYDANLNYPVIRISSFNNRTSKRVAEAIAQAKDHSGSSLEGIIMDLRGNPGGLLHEAIDTADLMMDYGIISQTRGRNPLSYQKFEAEKGNILGDTKMVILVDGYTASAAEILAAGLQDQERAIVIGSTTFGKGTVQNVLPLSNKGELQLTWARYLAPLGYHLQGYGVLPNICTENEANGIAAVLKSLRANAAETKQTYRQLKKSQFVLKDDISTFRNHCLWQGEDKSQTTSNTDDPDIEAAKTLLSNDDLYQEALSLSIFAAAGS